MQESKEFVKIQVLKIDEELEATRAKKLKGEALKKQREKMTALSTKILGVKKIRENIDEVINSIEMVTDWALMKSLQAKLKEYMDKSEDQAVQ